MLSGVLIAQRGAVAVRLAETCRRLGVHTWLVCASEPAVGRDVEACDHVLLVPRQPQDDEAYAAALVAAAKQVGAEAIHPGMSQPSEANHSSRAGWRQALRGAEFRVLECQTRRADVFVSAEALQALASDCSVALWTAAEPVARARRIHVPMVLYGGQEPQILPDVQTLPAQGGSQQVDSLPCLHESPACSLNLSQYGERVRDKLLAAAGRLAAALQDGVGLVTFAFDVDVDDSIWLIGALAGLQPLHAMSEMMLGIDVVELQLRAAAGETPIDLPATQPGGCAVMAHLRAFPSSAAEVVPERCFWPESIPGRLRVELDPTLSQGEPAVGQEMARLIAGAPIRHRAMLLLDRALSATAIAPAASNVERLRRILADEAFRAGQYDSSFAV